MSTRINISVDSDILLERNRQQVDVNRLKFLTDAAREDAAQEGVDRRNQDLIAAGIDPETRRPLDTSAIDPRPNFEEPGAFRRGDGVLLEPKSDYVDYGGTLTGLQSTTRGSYSPSVFSRFSVGTADPDAVPEMEFLSGGGPDGKSNALRVRRVNEEITNTFYPPEFPGDSTTVVRPLTASETYFEGQNLIYAAAGPYDTVLPWQWTFTFNQDGDSSAQILNLQGDIVDAIPRAPAAGEIKSCTHEIYIRLGSGVAPIGAYEIRNEDASFADNNLLMDFRLEGMRLLLALQQDVDFDFAETFSGGNRSKRIPKPFKTLTLQVQAYNATREGPFTDLLSQYLASNDPEAVDGAVPPRSIYDPKLPADVEDGTWFHLAVVRTPVPDSNLFTRKIYLDGIKVVDNIVTTEEWATTFGLQPVSARIALSAFRGRWPPAEVSVPSIHGYRFTPKALYTGESFTPPPSIRRLA